LRAAQVVVDEGLARLILVGRPSVIERRIERHGLRIRPGTDFELVNPESDPRYRDYWTEYHHLTERRGVSLQFAQMEMRRRHALMTALAAEVIRRFGVVPKAALLSHSSFGTSDAPSAQKMRAALELIHALAPDLEIESEMHGDAALNAELRLANFPRSRLKEEANLLIMPTLDAANIAFNLLKTAAGDGITIGPILLGAARPVHILTSSATVRRIVNMTALTVVDANAFG